MARKPKQLNQVHEARFLALVGQGWTAKAITGDLNASGAAVSRSWVDARMRSIRGHVAPPRAVRPPSLAPPEDGPDGDDMPTEDDIEAAARADAGAVLGILAKLDRISKRAEAEGNLSVVSAITSKEILAMSLLHKMTPPERPDPNDQPDMVKLGAEVPARLLKAIDLVTEVR